MLTAKRSVRPLGRADLAAFTELAERDPVVNVFALYRSRISNLEPRWLGGEMLGRFEGRHLVAACHAAANLVPVQASDDDATALAEFAISRGRRASTLVGPQDPVRAMWNRIGTNWGTAREERWDQRHLMLDGPAAIAPDLAVRASVPSDLMTLFPACVAMYTEEVGVSPIDGGAYDLYRARVQQLIGHGWSFVRYDGAELIFKAEVACATTNVAQIQGVWVPPHRRGEGLATAGMAAVVEQVRARIAPTVSLYVNDWNHGARKVYERVGFRETARFATVMF